MMTSRNVNTYGIKTTTRYDSSSGVTTSDETRPVAYQDSFVVLNAGQINGDHKKSGNHSFRKYKFSNYSGSILGTNRVDSSYDLQKGDMGIQVQHPILDQNYDLDYNAALSKMYERLRGSLDLSVDIAQSGEVVKMLRDARKLTVYVLSFKKNYLRQAWRDFSHGGRSKKVGSKWLEFQYGWKPLAQSLYDSVHTTLNRLPNLMVCEGRSNSSETINRTLDSSVFPSNLSATQKYIYRKRAWVKARFAPSHSFNESVARYTSLNPVSIAWELTPYSFVVDWFVDIGDYIRSFESALLNSSTFVDGFIATGGLIEGVTTEHGSLSSGDYDYVVSLSGGFRSLEYFRSVLSDVPFPRPPQFQVNLGSGRLLNLASLLSQHLGR
jgi:hypothetical protein